MTPAKVDSACDEFLVSPRDVVSYLVQNEPLTHVAEISRCVDGYTSQLRQNSFAIETLNAAIDTGERMTTSIDELLTECQGFHSATRKRMQQAENAIDTRSQDLRRAVAQLHKTPLTTPPVSSLGSTTHSIPQMSAKVEEIGTAQTKVLNALEASKGNLKATLGELSGQESMESLLSALISQIHGPAPPPLGTVASRRSRHSTPPLHPRALLNLQSHDSLWERYHWGVQEFQSGVDRIVRNGETIRDLALVLEKPYGLDPPIAPPERRFPTLAEELLVNPGTWVVPPSNPHNRALRWRSLVAWLKVWAEYPIRGFLVLVFAHLPVQPPFIASTSLTILFVLANIMRARYCISNSNYGRSVTQTANSIRELLLGDSANVSDELIRNLVPRG